MSGTLAAGYQVRYELGRVFKEVIKVQAIRFSIQVAKDNRKGVRK